MAPPRDSSSTSSREKKSKKAKKKEAKDSDHRKRDKDGKDRTDKTEQKTSKAPKEAKTESAAVAERREKERKSLKRELEEGRKHKETEDEKEKEKVPDRCIAEDKLQEKKEKKDKNEKKEKEKHDKKERHEKKEKKDKGEEEEEEKEKRKDKEKDKAKEKEKRKEKEMENEKMEKDAKKLAKPIGTSEKTKSDLTTPQSKKIESPASAQNRHRDNSESDSDPLGVKSIKATKKAGDQFEDSEQVSVREGKTSRKVEEHSDRPDPKVPLAKEMSDATLEKKVPAGSKSRSRSPPKDGEKSKKRKHGSSSSSSRSSRKRSKHDREKHSKKKKGHKKRSKSSSSRSKSSRSRSKSRKKAKRSKKNKKTQKKKRSSRSSSSSSSSSASSASDKRRRRKRARSHSHRRRRRSRTRPRRDSRSVDRRRRRSFSRRRRGGRSRSRLGGLGRPFGQGRPRIGSRPIGSGSGPVGSRPPPRPGGMGGPPPGKFAEELWEAPREPQRLPLLGEMAMTSGRMWTYPVKDESRRSYVGYLPNPFSQEHCSLFFNTIRDGTSWCQPQGAMGPIPRKTAWMVATGCQCIYGYGGIQVQPESFPPWMLQIMEHVMPNCGIHNRQDWPNCCNLNLYENGGMSVGWHSDDERLFQGKFQDIRIISLSLGVTRKFEVRRNWPDANERPTSLVRLANGDLCTMEGMFQKHFQHRVPNEGNVVGPRINLTWRWVVRLAVLL